jgi:tight adherence protein C
MSSPTLIQPFVVMLCALWAAAAAGLAWYTATVARDITYVTLADGRKQARSIPLLFRLLLPLVPNVSPLFKKPAFTKLRTTADKRIVAAGYDDLIKGDELLSLQVVLPPTVGLLWCLLIMLLIAATHNAALLKVRPTLLIMGPALLFFYPQIWIKDILKKRHLQIRRQLPFVLDLLTLSVEAGMDFMSSLQRNVRQGNLDPLSEELLRVIREIQVGKTRREALRDMGSRVNLPDLRAVVNALVQADELGVSIGSILRIQADQIRQRRFERAEKLANEAPVKLLFPLMFFIFPSVFLVLMGPIIVQLMRQGF